MTEKFLASGRTRIKFCGFTRPQDVDEAVALGVDAIGLVCVPASRRALSIDQAQSLRRRIPAFVSAVVLLLDAEAELVDAVVRNVQPDVLQFHGHETGAFCRSFNRAYMKAIAMGDTKLTPAALKDYADAAAWMFDSHTPGALGGSGKRFDWQRLAGVASQRLVVAGGLDANNVGQVISGLHPHAVDVSSGIERSPGIKDSGKMAAFVAAVRRADAGAADTN